MNLNKKEALEDHEVQKIRNKKAKLNNRPRIITIKPVRTVQTNY
jgi:hypothetical protein